MEYYPDGVRYEGYYKQDRREGKGILYFPNGNMKILNYLNGVKIN